MPATQTNSRAKSNQCFGLFSTESFAAQFRTPEGKIRAGRRG
jgi:hypothetical protein